MPYLATYENVHVTERHQMCEEAGQCWPFSLLPPQLSDKVHNPSQSKTLRSLSLLLNHPTPSSGCHTQPANPYFPGCADAAWLTLPLYGLKHLCSKQGSPDMQPWTGSKLQSISFCFMGMYFYSEPIWQCPDGLAKTYSPKGIQAHSCGHNACEIA